MTELITRLIAIVGESNVSTEPTLCQLYTTDVLTAGEPALAVIKPGSIQQLAACVKAAIAAGVAVVPRGGGMSYTSGYVPTYANSLLLDMTAMHQILDINTDDMYVTVEAGCTWAKLYEALQGTGWRTPFWGTLSGKFATVGGGLSQNCMFWGSGLYGTAADSVVSMSVVQADGSILETGSASHIHGSAWHRHFGPDLTGLFIGDNGALGFKGTVTLRLIPEQPVRTGLSFAADNAAALLAFASEVSRQQLASEVCGFDPFLQAQRLKRESVLKDLKALGGVMKAAGGLGKALKAGAQVALAGRGYMKDVKFSIHALIEERYQEVANIKEKALRQLAHKLGLREIENSIPKIMRANPFGPVNSMIGPTAERWAPVHCVAPHSKAVAIFEAVEAVYQHYEAEIAQHQIGCGYLFATVANNAIVIEPVFFWPEALNALHRYAVEPDWLKRLTEYQPNPEATAMVLQIRKAVMQAFAKHGSMHMQLGKAYPYQELLKPTAKALVSAIKQQIDPTGHINPGCLGLE